MIKAILFDLDATLVDRQGSLEPLLRGIHERFDLRAQSVDFEAFYKRFLALTNFGYTPGLQVYQTLVTEFSINASPDTLVDDHRTHVGLHSVVFPGTREVLTTLRADGYKLGIITNGMAASQGSKIDSCGLDKLMDTIIISGREGISKPDAAVFQLAANRLDTSCSECMFIGDHPRYDIEGAQAVGMVGVWLRTSLPWPDDLDLSPNHAIDTIAELLPIVESYGKHKNVEYSQAN